MRKIAFAVAVLALVASGGFASLASGADHRDSPLNMANATADINDVYAFRSPENNNNLVVGFTVNPLIAPSDNATRGRFDPNVTYQVHVDRNSDLADDVTLNIRMTTNPDQLVIEGLGSPIVASITAPGAAPAIYNVGGVKVFAGLRDDPFFFDLVGFQAFVAGPRAPVSGLRAAGAGNAADSFAGTNVLVIAIEAPITAVTGAANANTGTIKAWVSTAKNGSRIDRMGIPTINTALIPSAQKDNFNQGAPITDAAAYRATATTTINGLRSAVDSLFGGGAPQNGGPLGYLTSEQVAGALIPDIVTVNFASPVQFPNGRRLQDDVIDAALGVVLNRGQSAGISDGVNANDRPFGTTFPYFAEPHTAAAAAGAPAGGTAAGGAAAPGAIRPPSTGDAGLLEDAGAMWTMSGVMLLVALLLGGVGAYATVRNRGR